MIDHVTANVGDFERAKRFYEQALAPLGYSVQMEFPEAAGAAPLHGAEDHELRHPLRGAAER